MLQSHQLAKVLMRFVVLLLLIQFVTPAFARVTPQSDNAVHYEKTTYKNPQHESGITLAVFLKENSEEKNETDNKAPLLAAELIDFTFHNTVLTEHHSRFNWDTTNIHTTHEPLFKLYCLFLI